MASLLILLADASVVLTEDTDSFIIGDRVWVGGTKAGVISYIGDTQFAPGEWAGVTLDEPIGKCRMKTQVMRATAFSII